jgi:hypothetical protein
MEQAGAATACSMVTTVVPLRKLISIPFIHKKEGLSPLF